MKPSLTALLVAAAAIPVPVVGCGDAQEERPAFSTRIDNPYWPMAPGSRWVYRESDGDGAEQRVEVTVTDRTRRVAAGVTARVVHDVVTQDGELVEDTYDWYAQDAAGNVWYLGEDTKEYENGKVVTTAGSWEAGVEGARAGIVMHAHPKLHTRYKQEDFPGEAEDTAEVVGRGKRVSVPFGRFSGVLVTRDWNPLKRSSTEHKHYAPGVGLVLVEGAGGAREELLDFRDGSR
jgi:hypothetical protein